MWGLKPWRLALLSWEVARSTRNTDCYSPAGVGGRGDSVTAEDNEDKAIILAAA